MKHYATHLFPLTTGLVPRLRVALLPGLLAAGLASCGGPQATDTPANPDTGPAPVAADSLRPTPAPADATRTDTARAQLATPTKPIAKPRTVVKPAAAPVPDADVNAPSPSAEEVAAAAAPAVPEPAPSAPAAPTTRTQAGRVLDESGRPLAGATIMLKGSSKATTTDANGNYSLEVPAADNTFLIGYGGYEDETATARDGQPLNVTLLPKARRRR